MTVFAQNKTVPDGIFRKGKRHHSLPMLKIFGETGSLLSLYNGLVLPHLQYCLMVWGTSRATGMGPLGWLC